MITTNNKQDRWE